MTREYIEGKLTGQGNVDGIHIISAGKSYYAIQASNGRYYNRQGETLGKGFARYPLQRQARVSSHFNPYRRHPVTGRIAPHKGVDFAMPVGTPVIAPADGIVEKSRIKQMAQDVILWYDMGVNIKPFICT